MQNLFKKNYEDCDGQEFKARLKENADAVLLDVRSASEFKSGTIKGAKNSNMLSPYFSSEIGTLDPSKTYFVFCRSGARSGTAANMMSKIGLKVINLKGGISAWPR
ncbi:MAG: rhodanese-like domain-containing protein [Bacteroidetes bacterium]|nr:rhodanese-like domain-containing protein [Bacteroidota bacterium]